MLPDVAIVEGTAEQIPFPEYPTWQDKSAALAEHTIEWLSDESSRQRSIAQLRELKSRYAQPGASHRAAEYIVEQLSNAARRAAA